MYKLGRKFKYKKVQGGPKEKVEKAEENTYKKGNIDE